MKKKSSFASIALGGGVLVGVLILFLGLSGGNSLPSMSGAQAAKFTPTPWPPVLDQSYPDLELINQDGQKFHLSDFKGKLIIVEPVGMNCPACQAWAGGHEYGPFQGNALQKNLPSFKQSLPLYADGITLPDENIVLVQLLLYDMRLGQPQPDDAEIWAEHFKMQTSDNHYVAVSPYDMRNNASYNMVPGFQLIDKDFILRSDATGHHPKHDLYRTLLPMVSDLK